MRVGPDVLAFLRNEGASPLGAAVAAGEARVFEQPQEQPMGPQDGESPCATGRESRCCRGHAAEADGQGATSHQGRRDQGHPRGRERQGRAGQRARSRHTRGWLPNRAMAPARITLRSEGTDPGLGSVKRVTWRNIAPGARRNPQRFCAVAT